MYQWTSSELVHVMAWCLFCAKPLSEPMPTYSQLDLYEQTSVRFEWKYITLNSWKCISLQWRRNGLDGVLNHQPHHCLLNRLFRRTSKKTSKLRVTGLCAGNSPGTREFPAQIVSNAQNVSIWWRHHLKMSSAETAVILSWGRWVN